MLRWGSVIVAIGLQALLWLSQLIRWWDFGPSVTYVIEQHVTVTFISLLFGLVGLLRSWRFTLTLLCCAQAVFCFLSAGVAIHDAEKWLVADYPRFWWDYHPKIVGYAFYGLETLSLVLALVSFTRLKASGMRDKGAT